MKGERSQEKRKLLLNGKSKRNMDTEHNSLEFKSKDDKDVFGFGERVLANKETLCFPLNAQITFKNFQ